MKTKPPDDDVVTVYGFPAEPTTPLYHPSGGDGRFAEQILENPPERPRRLPRWMNQRMAGRGLGLFIAFLVVLMVSGPVRRTLFGAGATAGSPVPGTMVWSVRMGANAVAAVISEPPTRQAVVLAVPAQTSVDLPGGGPGTFGAAATTPGMAVAAAQATVNIRVPHYLVIDQTDLAALVDRLGGIEVDAEAAFKSGSQTLGPGVVKLFGSDALAYLATASDPDDLTARWEDLLTGLLGGPDEAGLWIFPLGQSDDVTRAARMLAAAHGSLVGELPTAPSDLGLAPGLKAIAAFVQKSFAAPGAPLVRVVVLNGNGRPGMGALISARLAPLGYRVVSAQNASSFKTEATQVVAGDESFIPQADQVVATLGVGKVYVGVQPTGIADVTIIVGKDFGKP